MIVPNHSYISTATSVTLLEGKIKFCDTKSDFTMDEQMLKKIIVKNSWCYSSPSIWASMQY